MGVGLNHVQPGQPARQPHDMADPDLLRLPAGDHLVAPRIVAQRRDVIDRHAEPGEVDRRVERVAAPPAREPPVRGFAQLDHTLADAGNPSAAFTHDGDRLARQEPAPPAWVAGLVVDRTEPRPKAATAAAAAWLIST